jgi:hypothetical protein
MDRRAPVSRLLMFLVVGAALATGCSSTKVLIPPRVDLSRYGTIGMIEFTSQDDPHLAGQASREFLAAIQEAQPGTPVLELGKQDGILRTIHAADLDPPTIRAIGEKYQVDAIVVGMLGAQEVKPKVAVGGALDAISASAEMEGLLDARIYDTKSGATVWTRAARAKEQVARVDLSMGGLAGMGANTPGESKNRLVQSLVERATVDFWSHWEKQ